MVNKQFITMKIMENNFEFDLTCKFVNNNISAVMNSNIIIVNNMKYITTKIINIIYIEYMKLRNISYLTKN